MFTSGTPKEFETSMWQLVWFVGCNLFALRYYPEKTVFGWLSFGGQDSFTVQSLNIYTMYICCLRMHSDRYSFSFAHFCTSGSGPKCSKAPKLDSSPETTTFPYLFYYFFLGADTISRTIATKTSGTSRIPKPREYSICFDVCPQNACHWLLDSTTMDVHQISIEHQICCPMYPHGLFLTWYFVHPPTVSVDPNQDTCTPMWICRFIHHLWLSMCSASQHLSCGPRPWNIANHVLQFGGFSK